MDIFLVFGLHILRQRFVSSIPSNGSVCSCMWKDAQRLPTAIIEDIGAERLDGTETVGCVPLTAMDKTIDRLDGTCIVAYQQLTEMSGCSLRKCAE